MESFHSFYSYKYIFFIYLLVYYWIVHYYTAAPLSPPPSRKPLPKRPSPYYEKSNGVEYSNPSDSTSSKQILYYKEFKRYDLSSSDPCFFTSSSSSELYQLRCSGTIHPFPSSINMKIQIHQHEIDVPLQTPEFDVILDLFHVNLNLVPISFCIPSEEEISSHCIPSEEEISLHSISPSEGISPQIYIDHLTVCLYKVSNANHYHSILLVRKKDTYIPFFYDTLLSM